MNNVIDFLNSRELGSFTTVKRWNGNPVQNEDNLPHHSWLVTAICKLLLDEVEKENESKVSYEKRCMILEGSLFHDFDEVFSGDVKHNLKYGHEDGKKIRALIKKFVFEKIKEYEFLNSISKVLLNLEEDKEVKSFIKIGDLLSDYFLLKREMEMGNNLLDYEFVYLSDLILRNLHEFPKLSPFFAPGLFKSISLYILQGKNKLKYGKK